MSSNKSARSNPNRFFMYYSPGDAGARGAGGQMTAKRQKILKISMFKDKLLNIFG
jgi:hypothetical protein